MGAGLAGANAAVELRAEGFRGRLVLLGDEETLPFGRPPLSKTYLRAEELLDAWFVRPADWYDANEVELRRGASMSRVDTDAKEIWLKRGGRIRYDHVVLCTGGRPRTPALPGIHLPGVHVLRTVADCDAIKHVAKPRTRAVVVGMGFIGSEVAASLNALNVSVTAVLSGRSPLETVLGAEAGAVMAGIHRGHGVELIPEDAVVGFEGEERLKRVLTKTGVRIECDFAVVGAGIEPNVEPVAATSVGLENGILVDAVGPTSQESTPPAMLPITCIRSSDECVWSTTTTPRRWVLPWRGRSSVTTGHMTTSTRSGRISSSTRWSTWDTRPSGINSWSGVASKTESSLAST